MKIVTFLLLKQRYMKEIINELNFYLKNSFKHVEYKIFDTRDYTKTKNINKLMVNKK